jgi:hypothetical protein
MRTWAHWTAKTVMLTATFAAAGSGMPGAAFAETSGASGAGGSGCGGAAAVLGDSAAGCEALAPLPQAGGSAVRTGGAMTGQPHTMPMMTGQPHSVPMRRLGAAPPAAPPMAGSLLPGLATLPVVSALENQPAQAANPAGAANAGSVRRPSVPAGVHLPWASKGRLPLGTTRGGVTRLPRTHGKTTVVPRTPARQAAPRGLAVLGALPAVAGTPDLTDHAAPPAGSAMTADSTAVRNVMPASTLAADSAPGMGSASFYCLAIGALMAGAVALKMAGRRIRGRMA